VDHQELASYCNLGPQAVRRVIDTVRQATARHGTNLVILTGGSVRFFLRQLIEAQFPNVTVLSQAEIPAGVRVVSLGTVGGNE